MIMFYVDIIMLHTLGISSPHDFAILTKWKLYLNGVMDEQVECFICIFQLLFCISVATVRSADGDKTEKVAKVKPKGK